VTDLLNAPLLHRTDEELGASATRPVDGLATGTIVPSRDASGPPAGRPRRLRSLSAGILDVLGAAAASVSITVLLFGRLAPFSGLIAFVVVDYLLFLGLYAVLVSLREDRLAVADRLMTVLLYSAALMMGIALVFIVSYVFFRGWSALRHVNFFDHDLSRTGGLQPLTSGGVEHAIVGTLWMISLAMVITVPLGLVAALYLNEVGGRFARFVRTIVEAMTALPSIVAGLFIFALYILTLHFEKSALAAALALSVDVLPIIIRSADVVLRLVPSNLREASAALGAPQWRSARHVVLPTARSGLATAVILGMARGLGETSPVLLTAGYTTRFNTDPVHGAMVSLPLAAFDLVKTGQRPMVARGFAAAALLLMIVLVLFVFARLLGGRGPGQVSKRKANRIRRASTRDANRIIARYQREQARHGGPGVVGPAG